MKAIKHLIGATLLGAAAATAQAATVTWTQWTSNTAGTAGAVNVTYSGELSGLTVNYPSWTPAATWVDGTVIGNAPPAAGNMVVLLGGGGAQAQLNTITFSQPVTNPVFAIWSLGQPGVLAAFEFNDTPTFVAGGANAEFGGSAIAVSGNTVSGSEGNGSVVFQGTFSSISWTNPIRENYYGFTVGIDGGTTVIPLPAAAWLFGSGLLAAIAFARRRAALA